MCSADQLQTYCFGLIGIAPPEDKFILDNYPGEPGYSPRMKLAILTLTSSGLWAVIAAVTIRAFQG